MNPHTIAETLILQATIDMVKTMCGEAEAKKLTSILLQIDVSCDGQDAHALTFILYTCRGMLFTRTYCSVSQFPSMKGHRGCSVCCVAILTKNRFHGVEWWAFAQMGLNLLRDGGQASAL